MNENEYQWNALNEKKDENTTRDTDYRYVNSNTDYQYNAYTNPYPNSYANKKVKKPKKSHPFLKKVFVCMTLGILFGFFTGVSFYAVKSVTSYSESQKAVSAVTKESEAVMAEEKVDGTLKANDTITSVVTDVTGVVDEVMPSVVSITNMFVQQEEIWGQTLESKQEAGGSGIIIGENEEELLIVTNYHVVEGATELHVKFIDDSESTAQLKGSNSAMDLAVVAVQMNSLSSETKENIAVANMGDSESLKVGEPAIAIGNALGYGQSVTTGVISALNRSLLDATTTPTGIGSDSANSLIQTDAAINPGNSGGALLNVKGEVIGINSNKIGGTVVEGMGYAIPISTAKPIIEELMTKKTRIKVAAEDEAYLGIMGVAVTQEVASVYSIPQGVLVKEAVPGTGAAEAGLVEGDIITKFDGSSINSMEDLQEMLKYYEAGSQVEITISQGSPNGWQEKNVTITLSKRPAEN